MHPLIALSLAKEMERARLLTAEKERAVRPRAIAETSLPPARSLVIRLARPADARALDGLARLDSAPAAAPRIAALANAPWEGGVLVAEVDGAVQAARVLEDGTAIADPFRATAGLTAVLALRAEQLAAHPGPRRRGLPRLALRPHVLRRVRS
ncbi:MAG TPA: hypothetical protein VES79_02350 [Solirubrobacteraceae bacterium]|nr:hypothetical protein [Solirubrobacteraceae bacterium]